MFKNNKIIKKIGAGFMAGLCAFSMLGTSMGGAMTAKAEYIAGTENPAFPDTAKTRRTERPVFRFT